MTVRELIEELKRLPPDLEVRMAYCNGDYWRTMVAPEIDDVDVGKIKSSARCGDVLLADDVNVDEGDEVKRVVVIQ